jgi:hypothetical protein
MACDEIRELEAGYESFAERRQTLNAPVVEKRIGPNLGRRIAYSRRAFLVQTHSQTCAKCNSKV